MRDNEELKNLVFVQASKLVELMNGTSLNIFHGTSDRLAITNCDKVENKSPPIRPSKQF